MTGYGKLEFQIEKQNFQCEIKSLNSKGLEINFKTPSYLKSKEIEIRNLVGAQLERGKIDILFTIQEIGVKNNFLEEEKFQLQFDQLKQFAIKNGVSTDQILPTLLLMQDKETSTEQKELNEESWKIFQQKLLETMEIVWTFRQREGVVLFDFFQQRINDIAEGLTKVKEIEKDRFIKQKDRLQQLMSSNFGKTNFDVNRLEQEMIFYLEKMDISEEISRLNEHLNYFKDYILNQERSLGKKMGFIAQEMGREINTLGAKANDAVLQRIVVDMKDELEKIKEQIANVL